MRTALPAHPSSVGRARRLVREQLQGTSLEPLVETAELVVSEVVTNAIVHTGAEIELAALLDGTGLRVEVADSSTHLPVVASYTSLSSTGRGLHLVAELTDRWGVEPCAGGKVFWFHLGLKVLDGDSPDAEMTMPDVDDDPRGQAQRHVRDAGSDAVEVVLLNLPALIHGAWQQHAKALLRDLLLLGIDEHADHEIEAHAAAMDALAILEEQLGTLEVGEDPAEILALAAEPLVTRDVVEVTVPRESVRHFAVLSTQLDAALTHAEAGRLLTPPTQPEFVAFRRWVCDQVRSQAEGGRPRPWSTPARPPSGPAEPATPLDDVAVGLSARALVAADRAGLIVAASPAAIALLKYETPGDLVGKRLIEIIPTRYHQAHLAGFTLYHVTGRSPLLGGTVTVPVRCRDDSEIEVRLTITAPLTPEGDSIFVADLSSG